MPAPVRVQADGFVVPAHYATLSVAVPGVVAEVYVDSGDVVEAGTPLLALQNDAQRAALAAAEANLSQAEANLARLAVGPRPGEVTQAQARVEAAEARLERLRQGATPEQIASARQTVAVAQAQLAVVREGPAPDDVHAAEARVEMAQAELTQAQSGYDRVAWNPGVSAMPQSLRLQDATIRYEWALADYNSLIHSPTTAQLNVYQQQVRQAQAALDEVLAGTTPADLRGAEADVQAAEGALELVEAGATAEEIAMAAAQVEAARAARDQAQAALDLTVLAAPFAGTVSALNFSAGEYATPGLPAIRLGDLGAWQVQTDNLSELDVVQLAVGDDVEVTFDALPGRTLRGTVRSIQPAADLKRGDVTYAVTIDLAAVDGDLPLRWGMSAAVVKR
jgi:HlyD family secretion protein